MKVKLKIIFSRNEKIGSRLISWASDKTVELRPTPSHVALLVNGKWVFQSTLEKNVHIMGYKEWTSINQELYSVEVSEEYEYSKIKELFRSIEKKKYDWGGIIYYGIRWALNKVFNLRMPHTNIFQSRDRYFCCEVAGMLLNHDYSMNNPAEVYLKLINN